MAKVIKITPEYIQKCRDEFSQEFEKIVSNMSTTNGKLKFDKTIGQINRKATVVFSEMAHTKMTTLVHAFSDEVAWHGVAYRDEDESKDRYYIRDILVYPQTVTGATVNTDQVKYQEWLMAHDDETFNNIRFQGHSHVNMGVSPSGVDTTHQEQIVAQLEDDMFYIFMICNKKGDVFTRIYDMKKNVMFESADVTIEVYDGEYALAAFLKGAKQIVERRTYTTPQANSSAKPQTTSSVVTPGAEKKNQNKKTKSIADGGYILPKNASTGTMEMYDYGEYFDEEDLRDPFFYSEGPWSAYGGYNR